MFTIPALHRQREFYMTCCSTVRKAGTSSCIPPKAAWTSRSCRYQTRRFLKKKLTPKLVCCPSRHAGGLQPPGWSGEAFKQMTKFVTALYKAYDAIDASLFEINPSSRPAMTRSSPWTPGEFRRERLVPSSGLRKAPRHCAKEDPTEVEAGRAQPQLCEARR